MKKINQAIIREIREYLYNNIELNNDLLSSIVINRRHYNDEDEIFQAYKVSKAFYDRFYHNKNVSLGLVRYNDELVNVYYTTSYGMELAYILYDAYLATKHYQDAI